MAAPDTVAAALALARHRGVARLDAQLLLSHHLQCSRSWVIAHDDAALMPATAKAYAAGVEQRAAGVPLAYLRGEREFHGLALHVTPAVLVPRPETETLVDWAVELLGDRAADVVDLGTGSGAIALAVKRRCPNADLTATDTSAAALAVARGNASRLGLGVRFVAGDWWQPLAGRRFALALCNPPYIAADDHHLQALQHEPHSALTPGGDGLSALRQVIDGATAHLLPGAWLLLEHGHGQAAAVRRMLTSSCGFGQPQTRDDLAGRPRCTGAVCCG